MIYLLVSFALLILSYFFLKKTKTNLVVFWVFVFLYFIISTTYLISNYFTWNWVDESVIYHLIYWLGWAWFGADINLIIFWIFAVFLWLAVPIWLYFYWRTKRPKTNITFRILSSVFFILAFTFHPILKNFYDLWYLNFSWETLAKGISYKIPEVKDNDSKKKNIIYIYLESFENLYLNNDIFPSLTPNLNKLKEKSIYFSDLHQAYGTSWTIAWMVWSQCWIPLINSWWWGNSMHWINEFLPGAFCMWDFLNQAGYELSYIWWARLEFAWKWNFYKTHWFKNISWKNQLEGKLKDKDYQNDWWLYDDSTFDFAFEEYEKLSKSWKNFWLFMLTLDTHGEHWVISDSCKDDIYNKENPDSVLNSYHCTDALLWKFIEKLKNHKNFKDTIIVLSSDHYAMTNNNSSDILRQHQDDRRKLFMIIDWENFEKVSKTWTTLDIWPTVLDKLWFDVDGIWFWVNLFKDLKSVPNDTLKLFRSTFESFWKYPSIKNGVRFDLNDKRFFVWDESISYPALLYLNDQKEVEKILWKDTDNSTKLEDMLEPNSIFVDFCEDKKWFCLIFSWESGEKISETIYSDSAISYDEIIEKIK